MPAENDPEAALGKELPDADVGRAMKVERKQLFYKNIFLETVSLNAAKLEAWSHEIIGAQFS
jgi:hypothetical protein